MSATVRQLLQDKNQPPLIAVSPDCTVFQALLGMWTVTLQLWPQVVTAHLLGGFATLSLLFLLCLRLSAALPVLLAVSRQGIYEKE
mgnify:CR=1 FL=1